MALTKEVSDMVALTEKKWYNDRSVKNILEVTRKNEWKGELKCFSRAKMKGSSNQTWTGG